ncbi:hypothetical protein [Catellatospora sp. NPDC049133]|uniref:hypothetical protein n=1 Tax=Catellatospora sp. NPDC049133 TaxID=3155499 RepID=UPI0033C52D03
MTHIPPPLPDTFETAHARRMGDAHTAGDDAELGRARRHLVAEASTTPEEAAMFDAAIAAALLGKELTEAVAAGDRARADALTARLRSEEFEPEIVQNLLMAMHLQVGRQQGWLPEQDYDQLARFTQGMGPDVAEILRQIGRGRP